MERQTKLSHFPQVHDYLAEAQASSKTNTQASTKQSTGISNSPTQPQSLYVKFVCQHWNFKSIITLWQNLNYLTATQRLGAKLTYKPSQLIYLDYFKESEWQTVLSTSTFNDHLKRSCFDPKCKQKALIFLIITKGGRWRNCFIYLYIKRVLKTFLFSPMYKL